MSGAPAGHTSIVWLRRDLRLSDNAALYEACSKSERVCVAFVVNPPMLRDPSMGSPIVCAFFEALGALREDLRARGSDLAILIGDFTSELRSLAKCIEARAMYYNVDYEPAAVRRDATVEAALRADGLEVAAFVDHVYFSAGDVLQNNGSPYRVFTPYKRRWLDLRTFSPRLPFPSLRALEGRLLERLLIGGTAPVPKAEDFGFSNSAAYPHATEALAHLRLRDFLDGPARAYQIDRNIPSLDGTSRLSHHLRAGTIGVRTCVEQAVSRARSSGPQHRESIETWIAELVWRDFYQSVLKWFPKVENAPFLLAAQNVPWRSDESDFSTWCDGRTGYPIVDAAMRQLNETGWMHNRLRMIAASFLSKHLLIDWHSGERYFHRQLADADLAQNNGGWQWAASTGTDAVPYFRIFNPVAQGKRFDPAGTFVKHFIPELANVPTKYVHEPWMMPPLLQAASGVTIGREYPAPIVVHNEARSRAIHVFKSTLGSSAGAKK